MAGDSATEIALGEAAGARGRPYAGLSQSGMGYRAAALRWPWTVDQQFNVGVDGARQHSLGGMLDHRGGGPDPGRGVTF